MEVLYRGGRPVGMGLAPETPLLDLVHCPDGSIHPSGQCPPAPSPGGPVALASVMTGAAAGLLAYVLKAPLWGSILVGAGGAVATKVIIDRA